MKHGRLWRILSVLFLTLVLLPVSARAAAPEPDAEIQTASGTCGDSLNWRLSDDNVLTISGTGNMTDYSSESAVPWAGLRSSVHTVVVSEGVTGIGKYAFYNCTNLTDVSLPESLTTVGYYAFKQCTSLQSIVLPGGVTQVSSEVFSGCSALKNVTLPDNLNSISTSAFSNCKKLSSISFPDTLTYIGMSAFRNCTSLTDVVFPAGLTQINYQGFYGCTSLTKIRFPASLTSLGSESFRECSNLKKIIFTGPAPATLHNDAFLFLHATVYYPGGETWTESAMSDPGGTLEWVLGGECGDDLTWMVNDGILDIYGTGPIWDFNQSADVPWYWVRDTLWAGLMDDGVTGIGKNAFYGCSAMTTLTIPDGVTSIGSAAFYSCKKLTGVIIPRSVTSIGSGAFSFCNQLSRVYFYGPAPDIQREIFYNVTATAYYPAGHPSWTAEVQQTCGGSITWTASTVTPGILTEPSNVTAIAGENYSFSVEAYGGELMYEWYFRTGPDAEWQACMETSGGFTPVISAPASLDLSGYQFYCRITNPKGTVDSKVVKLTVVTKPKITTQPASKTVIEGDSVSFKVTATGGSLTYQWYYRKTSSDSWAAVSAASGKTDTYTLTTAARHNGYQYRCKVKNIAGTVYSKTVKLTVVNKPAITTQPASKTVAEGTSVTFKVAATGGGLSYQWYYRKSSSDSWTAVSAASGKTAAYTLTAAARHDGYQYRCRVKNAAGSVNSKTATLTVVSKPVITTQPVNAGVAPGTIATFQVAATGGSLSYQWYYRTSSSGTWTKVKTNGTSATYSLDAKTTHNGYQYRCKISNAAGSVTSKTVTLSVYDPPVITSQPKNASVSVGTIATFKVTASGTAVKYQWQYKKPGSSTWTNVSANGTSATYTITSEERLDGYQYRCKVYNAAGAVYTKAVTLTVA